MSRASRSGRRSAGFIIGMIVYALIVLAFVFVAVRAISAHKAAQAEPVEQHEISEAAPAAESRPEDVMAEYMNSLTDAYCRELAGRFTGDIDGNIQSDEAKADFIAGLFAEGVECRRYSAASTDSSKVFVICSGDTAIGTVTVEDGGSGWQVVSEEYDFSAFARRSEVSAASDCTVYCCGTPLGSEYITDTVEYELLKGFYESYPSLPHIDRYTSGAYLGEEDIVVLDPNGRTVDPENLPSEGSIVNNCSEEESANISDFAKNFINCYVTYVSGANSNSRSKYDQLKAYLIDGSDLQHRFYESIEGQEYAASRGDELTGVSVNSLVKLSTGYYLCDVSFTTSSVNRRGENVPLSVNTKLLITSGDSGTFVAEMLIY